MSRFLNFDTLSLHAGQGVERQVAIRRGFPFAIGKRLLLVPVRRGLGPRGAVTGDVGHAARGRLRLTAVDALGVLTLDAVNAPIDLSEDGALVLGAGLKELSDARETTGDVLSLRRLDVDLSERLTGPDEATIGHLKLSVDRQVI